MAPKSTPTNPAYNLEVSRLGLDLMVHFEVISESYYVQHLARPIWPGGASGVTIGIGYDLGYHDEETISHDWGGKIDAADLDELVATAGVTGKAAAGLIDGLRRVTIPLNAAQEVFYTLTLPRYARMTRKAYPGVEALPADAQAVLLSLVYNRGPALEGPRRRDREADLLENARNAYPPEELVRL